MQWYIQNFSNAPREVTPAAVSLSVNITFIVILNIHIYFFLSI